MVKLLKLSVRLNEITSGIVRESIWEYTQNPLLFGYSDLGFTNEKRIIQEGIDLIVFKSYDNGRTILDIEIYQGRYSQRELILQLIMVFIKKKGMVSLNTMPLLILV